jgi:putative sterol carrier protein
MTLIKRKTTYFFLCAGKPDVTLTISDCGDLLDLMTSTKKQHNSSLCAGKPDVTLTITDGDLVDLMTGKLNSQKAFFQGKLKVRISNCSIKKKTFRPLESLRTNFLTGHNVGEHIIVKHLALYS